VKEAAKRGLANVKTTPHALDVLTTQKVKDLYSRNEILTERELEARYEIDLELYAKKIQIESRVMADLASNHIVPIAIQYQNLLIENVSGLKQVLDDKEFKDLAGEQLRLIREVSERINRIRVLVEQMVEARKKANAAHHARDTAGQYCEMVVPFFPQIRREVDKLELIVSDELWPLPKYRELLFLR
jgi:glutamine synthetase